MIKQETTESKENYTTSRRQTRNLIGWKKRPYVKQQYEEMERNIHKATDRFTNQYQMRRKA